MTDKKIFIQTDGKVIEFTSGAAKPAKRNADSEEQEVGFATDELARRMAEIEDLVETCCVSMKKALKKVPQPEEVTLEFGVKAGGKVGVPFVTEGSAEANFKITVKWKSL